MAFLPFPAFAGAWVQEKGRALAALNATYFATDSYFDEFGVRQSQQKFNKQELNLYAEYGWRDSITVGTNLFLNRVDQGDDNYGLADSEFFARIRLAQFAPFGYRSVLSVQPLIKLPSFYEHGGVPQGGSESFDGELSLLYGINIPSISSRDYIDMRVGYRERTNDLEGQYRLDLVSGVYFSPNFSVTGGMRSIFASAVGNAAFANNGDQDYDLHKAELGAYYSINGNDQLSLNLFHHYAGRQAGAGRGITLGFIRRF